MTIESDDRQIVDASAAEEEPMSVRVREVVELVAALGTLVVGLDVSRLSDQELEVLRINDMTYLIIQENKRRLDIVMGAIKTYRNRPRPEGTRRARGGLVGKFINNKTYLTSDEEYII